MTKLVFKFIKAITHQFKKSNFEVFKMGSQQLLDKALHRIDDTVMVLDFQKSIESDSKLHVGMNSLFLTMRRELHMLKQMTSISRKAKLRAVFLEDYFREEKELNQVELAYITTQK